MKKIVWASCLALCGLLALSGCKKEAKLHAGTYEASGKGFNPDQEIRLSLTIDESGAIYEIHILEEHETEEIGGRALETLLTQAKEKNSAEVDTISGATRTSEGFRDALRLAMDQAEEGKKEEESKE